MKQMIVASLNTGLPKREIFQGKEVVTGIAKAPVSGRVHVTRTGFEHDGVADQKHHGGTDKALCIYSLEHYAYWGQQLAQKLPLAAFGENLTVTNLHEDSIYLGDRFRVGTALIEVSQPRQPCATLAARYGRKDLAKLMIHSGFTGFYCRVIAEGFIEKGDCLTLETRGPAEVSISYANRIRHHEPTNCEGIQRILAVEALSESWKQDFQKMAKKWCRL